MKIRLYVIAAKIQPEITREDIFLYFSGLNAVAVHTSGFLSYVVYKTKFQLQARSRTHALSGILCEKGKVLTGYTYRSLLILEGTPRAHYRVHLQVITQILY